MFSEEIEVMAKRLGRHNDLTKIAEDYLHHNDRFIAKTSLSPKLIDQTDSKILFGYNALRFIQLLLYRSKSLIEGSIILLNNKKMLPSLITIRAHYETTGSLCYSLMRLKSYYNGNILFQKLDEDFRRLALGATTIDHKDCPCPINAMTLIDAVDYLINKEIVRDKNAPPKMFRDLYDTLSDYCHPNFHGIHSGSEILHNEKAIIYNETDTVIDSDFPFFFNLGMSTRLFLHFYDEMHLLLNKKEIMPIMHKTI